MDLSVLLTREGPNSQKGGVYKPVRRRSVKRPLFGDDQVGPLLRFVSPPKREALGTHFETCQSFHIQAECCDLLCLQAAPKPRRKSKVTLESRSKVSGKSQWGLSKWGLKVLVHNCPRLPTIVVILRRKLPLERGPKRPQKRTIVDDCAQIAESGLKPPFGKTPFRLSRK